MRLRLSQTARATHQQIRCVEKTVNRLQQQFLQPLRDPSRSAPAPDSTQELHLSGHNKAQEARKKGIMSEF